MSQSTLEEFKAAKAKLLEDYKARLKEVESMRKELVSLGVIADESTSTTPAKKGRKSRGPRMSKEDKIKKITDFLTGKKEVPTTEIEKATSITQVGSFLSKEMKSSLTRGGKGGKQGYHWTLKK